MAVVLRFVPLLAVLGVLLFAGLRADPVPQTFVNEDKVYHFLGFAALAFVACMTFSWRHSWLVLIGCLLVGFGIEYGQSFQPLRTVSMADMAANAIGVLAGGFTSASLRWWMREMWA